MDQPRPLYRNLNMQPTETASDLVKPDFTASGADTRHAGYL